MQGQARLPPLVAAPLQPQAAAAAAPQGPRLTAAASQRRRNLPRHLMPSLHQCRLSQSAARLALQQAARVQQGLNRSHPSQSSSIRKKACPQTPAMHTDGRDSWSAESLAALQILAIRRRNACHRDRTECGPAFAMQPARRSYAASQQHMIDG